MSIGISMIFVCNIMLILFLILHLYTGSLLNIQFGRYTPKWQYLDAVII